MSHSIPGASPWGSVFNRSVGVRSWCNQHFAVFTMAHKEAMEVAAGEITSQFYFNVSVNDVWVTFQGNIILEWCYFKSGLRLKASVHAHWLSESSSVTSTSATFYVFHFWTLTKDYQKNIIINNLPEYLFSIGTKCVRKDWRQLPPYEARGKSSSCVRCLWATVFSSFLHDK